MDESPLRKPVEEPSVTLPSVGLAIISLIAAWIALIVAFLLTEDR